MELLLQQQNTAMAIIIGGVLIGDLKIPYPIKPKHRAQQIRDASEGIDIPVSFSSFLPPKSENPNSGYNKNAIYYTLTKIISEHVKFSPLKP